MLNSNFMRRMGRPKICQEKLESLRQAQWRFRDHSLHRFDRVAGCEGQTDGHTDRRLYDN